MGEKKLTRGNRGERPGGREVGAIEREKGRWWLRVERSGAHLDGTLYKFT